MEKHPITLNGYDSFQQEFQKLYYEEKPKWIKEKEIAAAFGDRSENAEYHAAKEMLRNIDRRLRYLNNIFSNCRIIDPKTLNSEKVLFGFNVVIQDSLYEQKEKYFQIVGKWEVDPDVGKISFLSPYGQILLGKEVGDVVELNQQEFEILDVYN